uniref:Uncharacterized protein LOC104218749 n=1 Tax=Nicotiana sylvestris TaxID=4096 RepID=A0A1U7W032_NICSY|nr:PREDICTED: uncharacterized protein LOC104218749 [Nicotiana sylvestris]
MKLNPEKCAFGVGSGKCLGFMVSNRGIEINPNKIKAIEEITVVNNVKAVQRLTRRIAALGRFISRSLDKSHHSFSLLKRKSIFEWTPKCQHALDELKRYLTSPPLLHTPKEDEMLYLYLAMSEIAVSGVLVREEQASDGHQVPNPGELRGRFLTIPRARGRERIFIEIKHVLQGMDPVHRRCCKYTRIRAWYSPKAARRQQDQTIQKNRKTNNEAEYEAMIADLELARSLGAETIEAKCDSLLVVSQVNGNYEAQEDRMQSEVDALANLGSSVEEEDLLPEAVVQLFKSVVEEGHAEINSTSLTWDWRNKYIVYLKDGKLLTVPKESRALRNKAAQFSLDENGALYRRTFDGPLAVCLGPGDTDYVLQEIHEGICENNSGADSLV